MELSDFSCWRDEMTGENDSEETGLVLMAPSVVGQSILVAMSWCQELEVACHTLTLSLFWVTIPEYNPSWWGA